MISSLLAWLVPAILVFWCVGAYNRLVRLRAEMKAAFANVDVELQRYIQLAKDLPSDEDGEGLSNGPEPLWTQVQAATSQLASSLAVARARPFDPQGIDALRSAGEVLGMAWEKAEREDAHDLAGPRLPETISTARAQLGQQVLAAANAFNTAVSRYNQAISQFPALLLAWVFGFKAGRAL